MTYRTVFLAIFVFGSVPAAAGPTRGDLERLPARPHAEGSGPAAHANADPKEASLQRWPRPQEGRPKILLSGQAALGAKLAAPASTR